MDFEEIIEAASQVFPLLLDDNEDRIYSILREEFPSQRGPRSKRRPNIDRQFCSGHQKLFDDYFAENPTYDDQTFYRRFRIPKPLFIRICEDLGRHDEFFTLRCDAAGKIGLSPIQKCTAALRMLAYGSSANSLDENIRISETTTLLTLRKFCSAVIDLYGSQNLCGPTAEDRHRLMAENSKRGFPGMLGSIDCMHWAWKNCPVALKGQYQGKEGKPTVVLEAIASKDGYIWHSFFGCPGSCNDINILDRSPLLNNILQNSFLEGKWTLGDETYDTGYLLADNIYPDWPIFLKSITQPQTAKEKHFAKCQEAVRKDVERAFGILQACWHILVNPCRLWDAETMRSIILTCIILHNMRVRFNAEAIEDEEDFMNDSSTQHSEGVEAGFSRIDDSASRSFTDMCSEREGLRNSNRYYELRSKIMDHLWSVKGDTN